MAGGGFPTGGGRAAANGDLGLGRPLPIQGLPAGCWPVVLGNCGRGCGVLPVRQRRILVNFTGGMLRSTVTTWQGQSKGRKRCPNSQGNFRIIENSTADVETRPYSMGPNFGQQNVVKTYNTCVVNFQILEYVIRVLIRVVRCTLLIYSYALHPATSPEANFRGATKRTLGSNVRTRVRR